MHRYEFECWKKSRLVYPAPVYPESPTYPAKWFSFLREIEKDEYMSNLDDDKSEVLKKECEKIYERIEKLCSLLEKKENESCCPIFKRFKDFVKRFSLRICKLIEKLYKTEW